MPLDIDAIRARHEPYADTRVAQDIAALLSELDRLASELAAAPGAARRWEGLREAAATVQAATGLGGDTPLDDDRLAEMVANALQDAARAHYAETALRTDAEAHSKATAHLRGLVEGQRARAERAEAELAAARRGPVVEWRQIRDFWRAEVGLFHLSVYDDQWTIRVVDLEADEWATIASGNEPTMDAGKAACEAAYRRAAGLG